MHTEQSVRQTAQARAVFFRPDTVPITTAIEQQAEFPVNVFILFKAPTSTSLPHPRTSIDNFDAPHQLSC
jgi:hypothetical protein